MHSLVRDIIKHYIWKQPLSIIQGEIYAKKIFNWKVVTTIFKHLAYFSLPDLRLKCFRTCPLLVLLHSTFIAAFFAFNPRKFGFTQTQLQPKLQTLQLNLGLKIICILNLVTYWTPALSSVPSLTHTAVHVDFYSYKTWSFRCDYLLQPVLWASVFGGILRTVYKQGATLGIPVW